MTRTSNAGNILLGILAIATVRNFLEFALEGQTLVSNADPLRDLKTYFLHFTSFYYLVFVSLSLIFYAFALKRLSISECFKIGALAMPMIWIGPVFGYLIGDPCDILYPNDPMGVLRNLHQMANPNYDFNGMTKGMRLEVMLAGLGAIGYLYYKTRRAITAVLGGICISAACLAIGLSIPFLTQYYEYGFHFGRHELYNSTLLHQGFVVHGTGCKIALFYIALSLVVAVCINETFFFFVLLYNLLAFLYSAPPFRLRKYFLLSNLVLATIFLLTLHAGTAVLISSYRFGKHPLGHHLEPPAGLCAGTDGEGREGLRGRPPGPRADVADAAGQKGRKCGHGGGGVPGHAAAARPAGLD